MATTKGTLKAAKTALDGKEFVEAASLARAALNVDSKNYIAHIFLGKALEEQGKQDDAATLYAQATNIKPDDLVAWQGLCHVYESQESRSVSKYSASALRLAELFAEREDLYQCQTAVDKLVAFAKEHGSRTQYRDALEVYLPTSSVYAFLEGRIQSPAVTYLRLAEITEADDKERIDKEVRERRTRLGAKVNEVVNEVRREVFNDSKLESLYQSIIDWTSDDNERREYEEKLLQYAYDHLLALRTDEKAFKRRKVIELAHGMVIIKYPSPLAWRVELEWQDISDVASIENDKLLLYARLFQATGLARVIQGFIGQNVLDDQASDAAETDSSPNRRKILGKDERLLLIEDGIHDTQDSALAQRLVASYYLADGEYESCIGFARNSLALTRHEAQKCGLPLQENQDAVQTFMATSLIYYQAPKNHPEARELFDDVLQRHPQSTDALLGIGLIHEEQENFPEAASFLERAHARAPDNLTIAAEAAWCKVLLGSADIGLQDLQHCLNKINAFEAVPFDLKARTSYRIGRCLWDMHIDKAARKDRSGPYAYFLAAIKADPSFAPAYTSLGQYYGIYARDKRRARRCFQKAFELSAGEVYAAEQLARTYADDAEWDIVEVVAQRVIDSGAVRPAPGSKRKAVSWPFAALAVVQMNKQEYSHAIHSYQAALRITSGDYHCWMGLGEAYLSAGRYNASSNALEHAQSLVDDSSQDDDAWFARYMHSNVHRELGDFSEAIAGYRRVLKSRPDESGVAMALLQCLVEDSHHHIETGAFVRAAELAEETLMTALDMTQRHTSSVNFWRAVGDACMVLASIPTSAKMLPITQVKKLLAMTGQIDKDALLSNIDDISLETTNYDEPQTDIEALERCLAAGLSAQKAAVLAATNDKLARSIAWYNLGWTEHHACRITNHLQDDGTARNFARCAKAAVKCFKHAIELEARNADFWNALGVVTTSLNPRVAQHSFVRSLHLNERSARTWTNLGSLYIQQQDFELAHEAFSRAQSTDPSYVYAWLGEGLIAFQYKDVKEARSHFRHALEIGDASDVPVMQQYASASFDELLATESAFPKQLDHITTPIFALQQIKRQSVGSLPFNDLLAMFEERAGGFQNSIDLLEKLADIVESTYEKTESSTSLGQFVKLKVGLARSFLAVKRYSEAIEHAETALDLSEEMDTEAAPPEARTKMRLSSHLTAGLARYHGGFFDDAVKMFENALEYSNASPDIVCLLTQVHWAIKAQGSRDTAKEHLLSSLDSNQGHIGATTLLGAMTALEGDEETHKAVISDLQSMRTTPGVSLQQQQDIDFLLATTSSWSVPDVPSEHLNEICRSIMLAPDQPDGWSRLAECTAEPYAAQMALVNTARAVPPDGQVDAEQLSKALAEVGTAGNAQKATALCPWLVDGWRSLQASLGEDG